MYKITLMRSLLALSIASLSACGGGGGGGGGGTPSNNAPNITGDSLNTREDSTLNHTVNASDADGDNLTFAIQSDPSHGDASISSLGLLTYTPSENYHGNDQLTVSVSDGQQTSSAVFSIDVLSVNDLPVLHENSASLTLNEDTPISTSLIASDVEGESLSYSLITPASKGIFDLSSQGNVTYTPNENENGNDTATIAISDGEDLVQAEILITINPINDAPELADTPLTINLDEDTSSTLQLQVSDAENSDLTYSVITQTNKGTIDISNSGMITYIPELNANGNDQAFIAVSDGDLSATADIQITINPVNDAPEFNQLVPVTVDINTDISGSVSATDADQDDLTFSLTGSLPSQVSFTIQANGQYSFKNESTIKSPIEIELEVSDGTLNSTGSLYFTANTDPLYSQQWHMHNIAQTAFSNTGGTAGHDINIGSLHHAGKTADIINIAVVDSGLEIAHEDLVNNVLAGRSYDFKNDDADPTPATVGGDHGTSVAGLIAAEGFNGKGGRGVAPDANLMGFNWLETQQFSQWIEAQGGSKSNDAHIINESYGATPIAPLSFEELGTQAEEAHYQNTLSNNNDRGVLFVKAAGNSFGEIQTGIRGIEVILTEYAYDGSGPKLSASMAGNEPMSSSFYQTVISALNADADNPLSSYSSIGSSVWVSAPGGEYGQDAPAMITTDLEGCGRGYANASQSGFNGGSSDNQDCHYTSTFNGTSSAAPVASGVAALVMQANDQLTWRDVRHILASTAKKIDDDFQPVTVQNDQQTLTVEPGWVKNDAGYNFHNWYGFGMVDAEAAVRMAEQSNYQLLSPLQETAFIASADISEVTIPENNTGVEKTVSVTDDITVESVQIKVSIEHRRDNDIMIEVESPSGTRSVVQQPRSLLIADRIDTTTEFNNTVLLSNAFYGEPSSGDWKIKVTDTNSGDFFFYGYNATTRQITRYRETNNVDAGKLTKAELKIYGH